MKKKVFLFGVGLALVLISLYFIKLDKTDKIINTIEDNEIPKDTSGFDQKVFTSLTNQNEDSISKNKVKISDSVKDDFNDSIKKTKTNTSEGKIPTKRIEKRVFGLSDVSVKILSVKKVWDKGGHNAFTGLAKYKGYWFCVFREGSDHLGRDGSIRIIKSADGANWHSIGNVLSVEGHDLRDPNIITNGNGELTIMAVSRYNRGKENAHHSYTWISKDGNNWNGPFDDDSATDTWRWAGVKKSSEIYSIAYSGKDVRGSVYKTNDGKKWSKVSGNIFPDIKSYPNESSLTFLSDGTLVSIVRQDRGRKNALLGLAKSPYNKWQWKDLGMSIGSPETVLLSDRYLLACVKLFGGRNRTSVCVIDINTGELKEIEKLPSGGDTGYAKIVSNGIENQYLISYHSSHEGKTSIYIAKIQISIT